MLIGAALLEVAGCYWMGHQEAVMVLQDVAAGDGPSRLKERTSRPERVPIRYAVEGRRYEGDLYRPEEVALAGLVLVPGVAQEGRDDSRLVAFATTLARARFVVLVPDLPNLRALRVQASDIVGVVDAFAHLSSGRDVQPPRRAGIGAFSYACGPAVLAALDPRIRDQVDLVLAVGGYYDLEAVLTFMTTGYFREEGQWRHMAPVVYGKWMFVLSNLDRLDDAGDREGLRRMAERRLYNSDAGLTDLVRGLGADGLAVYQLVENRDPDRVPGLIEALPEAIRGELAALTLVGRDLSSLQARLILVHGRDDGIIPYTESMALARAVPGGHVSLFVVDGLSHVTVRPEALDRRTLLGAVQALLAERGETQDAGKHAADAGWLPFR